MRSFVEDGFIRATTFFALAFGLMLLGGYLLGELRAGIEFGLPLAVAIGVFAYLFVKPTSDEDAGTADDEN
ncbi:hypothetical protein HWV23_03770 [Natronomonas halophila]|uniref:hypothetical protein n=1 Tax=Natronomonas halophila TaxID=2747817 RepID=UPI0015B74A89|nr:hypothetical protein [Natronomonas halophila]QLD84870.1 hypothetical protein HWV23_03770 [Natronomonas halophila]